MLKEKKIKYKASCWGKVIQYERDFQVFSAIDNDVGRANLCFAVAVYSGNQRARWTSSCTENSVGQKNTSQGMSLAVN